jgi:hypothetical protein
MPDFADDIFRHPPVPNDAAVPDWFDRMAQRLLNATRLMAAGQSHRLTEIEFYFCGPHHPDPFTHCDPMQRKAARWYFHRRGGQYRSGSFKGVDLTFGAGSAFGGILIRGIADAADRLIDGPSLTVDHLLRVCQAESVRELDEQIGNRRVGDTASPLYLTQIEPESRPVLPCSRVGLTLRQADARSRHTDYLVRAYRYLTEPRHIRKGKLQMVLGLHQAGVTPEEIVRQTGCPRKTVAGYLAEYAAGTQQTGFAAYLGKEAGPPELCRLHGIAARLTGSGG